MSYVTKPTSPDFIKLDTPVTVEAFYYLFPLSSFSDFITDKEKHMGDKDNQQGDYILYVRPCQSHNDVITALVTMINRYSSVYAPNQHLLSLALQLLTLCPADLIIKDRKFVVTFDEEDDGKDKLDYPLVSLLSRKEAITKRTELMDNHNVKSRLHSTAEGYYTIYVNEKDYHLLGK